MKNKKGNVSLYIIFIFISVIIITIGALVGPMGALFSSEMIVAGESILATANDSLSNIQDATIRQSVYDAVDSAEASAVTNIQVSSGFFQYSWLLLIIVAVLVLFLTSRRLVEFGGGLA